MVFLAQKAMTFTSMMNLLTVSSIKKLGVNGNYTLNNISFTQKIGKKLAIAGETGSGKTTLMKIIAGQIQSDDGAVYFKEKRVKGPLEQLLPGRPEIAYLSQQHELRNHYRVSELWEMANKMEESASIEIYRLCQVEHLLSRKTSDLSGGERQRIALANLLVSSPELLLLDEPFSNLDPIHKQTLKAVLEDVAERLGITVILTSHEPADTLSWADDIIVLKEGEIVQQASPEAIYFKPESEYVAGLFGRFNKLRSSNLPGFLPLPSTAIPEHSWILIRPECLQMMQVGNGLALPAVVEKISFLGSIYECQLGLTANTKILIWTMDRPQQVGSSVFVSFKAGAGFSLIS